LLDRVETVLTGAATSIPDPLVRITPGGRGLAKPDPTGTPARLFAASMCCPGPLEKPAPANVWLVIVEMIVPEGDTPHPAKVSTPRTYHAKCTADGKTHREIRRSLKRTLASRL
jgi:hypothetical protein